MTDNTDENQQTVVVENTKSEGVAAILAFLFGPLGLLYSTIMGAIIMFVIALPVVFFTAGLGVILISPACAVWGYFAAKQYNDELKSDE